MGVNLVAANRARGAVAALAVFVGLLALPGSAVAQVKCDTDQIVQEAQNGSVGSYPLACLNQAEALLSDYELYSPDLVQRVHAARDWTSTNSAASNKPRRVSGLSTISPVVVSRSPLASVFDRLAPSSIGEVPSVVLVLASASILLLLGGCLSAVSRSRSRRRMRTA